MSSPYYASNHEVFADCSLFVNQVLRSYINDKDTVSFAPILQKMRNSASLSAEIYVLSPFLQLQLSHFEQFCLILLLALEVDINLHAAYSKLFQHNKQSMEDVYRACVGGFHPDYSLSEDGQGVFDLQQGVLTFSPFFAHYLMHGTCATVRHFPSPEPLLIYADTAQTVIDRLATDSSLMVHLYGAQGAGKGQLVRYIAQQTHKGLLALDFALLRFSDIELVLQHLHRAVIFCKMEQGIVYLRHIPANLVEKEQHILALLLQKLQPHAVFVSSVDKGAVGNHAYANFVQIHLWNLSAIEKISVWEYFQAQYEAQIDAVAMGNKYVFHIGEIRNTFASARLLTDGVIDTQAIVQATKMRDCQLEGADLITTAFTFDDLVVDGPVKRQLDHVIHQMQYKHVLYSTWGFAQKIPYGRGISVLFYGPPGTGKTMAASVLANTLQLDLYRIDLSKLVSKYIGETEKNISSLFDKAKNMNVILFFDEADALFAKRAEVKDAHDKNANAETAHLLQKLEEYEGISILATNLFDQLDDAFRRRIKFMVPFVLPSEQVRLQLWHKILPLPAFLDEVDVAFFAKNFELSGSQIKEIILNACFIAISQGEPLRNVHLKEAVTLNYQKYGKRIANDEFLYLA